MINASMHREGDGWVVSEYDPRVRCCRTRKVSTHSQARAAVGEANCRHRADGKCQIRSHQHPPIEAE